MSIARVTHMGTNGHVVCRWRHLTSGEMTMRRIVRGRPLCIAPAETMARPPRSGGLTRLGFTS